MAGVMSALAAKNPDNSVLIIEPSNVLGGQGTAGGVAGFCGDTENTNEVFRELVNTLHRQGLISDYDPTADRRPYELEWFARLRFLPPSRKPFGARKRRSRP